MYFAVTLSAFLWTEKSIPAQILNVIPPRIGFWTYLGLRYCRFQWNEKGGGGEGVRRRSVFPVHLTISNYSFYTSCDVIHLLCLKFIQSTHPISWNIYSGTCILPTYLVFSLCTPHLVCPTLNRNHSTCTHTLIFCQANSDWNAHTHPHTHWIPNWLEASNCDHMGGTEGSRGTLPGPCGCTDLRGATGHHWQQGQTYLSGGMSMPINLEPDSKAYIHYQWL